MWKVLSKYHNLPYHFHDLKTILQTELDLLKTATSKNIQNIQEAVNSQQAYTMVLSGHINMLYTKLAHLDRQVQIHCIYPHSQSDIIQLNAQAYDPDIDGEPDPVTDIQISMQNPLVKIPLQVPQSQKTTLPFTQLPIGLSISPEKFHQIFTLMNMTMWNNNEQNTQVITDHNLKISQN